MRNSESDAYGESNSYIHADSNSYVYSDSDCDGNCHIHSDGDRYSNCDGHGNCDSYCDRIAAAYTDAAASADTAASPLALFRLRGTRENELASSRIPAQDSLSVYNGKVFRRLQPKTADYVAGGKIIRKKY